MVGSRAWALADHQVSHVYLQDGADQQLVDAVASLFRGRAGVARVLSGEDLVTAGLTATVPPDKKSRCGDLVIESTPESWQSYFYWLDDAKAPRFARTIDIHRKPGYDPLELHIDRTKLPHLDPARRLAREGLARGDRPGQPARDDSYCVTSGPRQRPAGHARDRRNRDRHF
jgi:hypothetical protein